MSSSCVECTSLDGVRDAGISYVTSPSFKIPMGAGIGVNPFNR